MTIVRRRWVRGLGIAAIVTGAAIGGVRVTGQTALAQNPFQTARAPLQAAPGCPVAPEGFDGILVSVPGIGLQPAAGFPPNTFEAYSFQFGVTTPASTSSGGGGGGVSRPKLTDITLTRLSDQNDPVLFKESLRGRSEARGDITIFRSVDPNSRPSCLTFKLESVATTGFSMSSGGDRPAETITLHFGKITMSHTAAGSSPVCWDTVRAQPC